MPRAPKDWDPILKPRLLPVTGYRDTVNHVTYIPWSDATMGFFGWEVIPHTGQQNILIYLYPTAEAGLVEIRCHITTEEPDPLNDKLLGKIRLPDFGSPPAT